MRFLTNSRLCFWTFAAATALMLLLSPAHTFAAGPSIPVRSANYPTYSRIVFEFPKLVGYHVRPGDGGAVSMDFDTTAAASVGGIKSPLIKNIKQVSGDILKIDMTLADGATVKHYRLQRKIVIDIYPSGATPKDKPAPEKPKETAAKPAEAPKAEDKKADAAPAPAVPALQNNAKTSSVTPDASKVPMPAVPVEPVEPAKEVTIDQLKAAIADPSSLAAAKIPGQSSQKSMLGIVDSDAEPPPDSAPEGDDASSEEITKITLSFLSPSRLAVFERSGALWIVTDSTAGTILPVITGQMASFIIDPKTLRFDEGTAYRYTIPRKFYPDVKKKNLSWEISLLTKPAKPPVFTDIKISFDQVSRKGRLIVPLKGSGPAITLEDPLVGDTLYVVPTNEPDQSVQNTRALADFEAVPASLGMVIRPIKDGMKAYVANGLVFLAAPDGLSVTPEGVGTPVLIGEADAVSDNDNNRLFDFPNWRQGGIRKLAENKQKLQDQIVAAKNPDERAGLLMRMAMLYFANNLGQEALGILELVQTETPDMEKNPDFVAIRGAANAMSGNYKEALQDLSFPPIQLNPEVNLWIGYAAAATEQWRMADRSFPKSNRLLLQYPDNIAIPFTIYMAESALHLGHTDTAKKLLDTINMTSDAMDPQYQAAIDYLRGETFSQDGQLDKAEDIWRPVVKGLDRLYHTKATLSLTRLLLQQKKITLKEAIDRIDNLRFAWRGDGLEIEVLRTLGGLKVQDNQVLSGLEDMNQAATLSDSMLDDSEHIRDEMRRILSDLFVSDQASKIQPLEAVSVYTEFNSLLPSGPEGVTAVLDFANYLIHIDLLSKAADIIEGQIKAGVPDDKIMSVGAKLAAVYLLNGQPQMAANALRKTEIGRGDNKIMEERILLMARALSQLNQTDAAIRALNSMGSENAMRLKADVLWRARQWSEAAAAIDVLLPDNGEALTEEDAQLVVNEAVAWKLAGKLDKLKDIKTKYEAAIGLTKMASTFGVVTRDGGSSDLSDRDTMLKIAGEVDMFKGFLDSYKAKQGKGS